MQKKYIIMLIDKGLTESARKRNSNKMYKKSFYTGKQKFDFD